MERLAETKKKERTLGREMLKALKLGLDSLKAAFAPLGMSDADKLRLLEEYRRNFEREAKEAQESEQ